MLPPLNSSDEVKPRPGMIARGVVLIPGIAICGVVTAISLGILEERVFVHPYVEALVIAVLFGMAIRSAWNPLRAMAFRHRLHCQANARCGRRIPSIGTALEPGKVYFLNTQKLTKNSLLVRHGSSAGASGAGKDEAQFRIMPDMRSFTIWEGQRPQTADLSLSGPEQKLLSKEDRCCQPE